ncbi:glycosyltransferase [Moellerella wisconsensis]|uniref:glycosyltransferase n=1 Tax=Moellerella wisconsensis TaxID=158849 RepID=UPI00240F7728|nr:glycosyltransferase [Moellerella wisconsensis]
MININKLTCTETEDEIISHWKYIDRVYISCVCIVYNHELYIRDTLDSILAQETEYKFELVIHDDKSTDGTRDILLEYKNKYPNIITLILQEENQYSKSPRIIPLTIPYLNGEYIALCEGDDYWIDKGKLEKQLKTLEKNKNINICFTAGFSYNTNLGYNVISQHDNIPKIYSFDSIIIGGGEFIPTASIMVRKKTITKLPIWYFTAPVGDYFLQIFASAPSGALYLPDITICYRINTIGSWSSNRSNLLPEDIINEAQLYEKTFAQLRNDFTENNSISIAMAKQYYKYSIILLKSKKYTYSSDMIKKSWACHKNIHLKQNLIYKMRRVLPILKFLTTLLQK